MKLRVLHASPTWFSPSSVVGGGERWVDNVMLALTAGAPWVEQAMVAIGKKPELSIRGRSLVRVLANERQSQAPMDAISSRLWSEFESFDVIHVHQSLTDFGAYACSVAASLGKTLIATDLGGGTNPVMTQGGLRLADGVVSISEYAHRMAGAAVRGRSIVLIGPVDTEAFTPAASRPRVPAAICVSRIMPHKGIDRIIRALPYGLKLRVVGRVYHAEYRELLGKLAAGKDVEFIHTATDEDLLGLYQNSTLFLQGSCMEDVYGNVQPKTELMGLTTLEAMSCGLPAIVSADGGSLPELVANTSAAAVFSDHQELETLLHRHLAGFWPSQDVADIARSHVLSRSGLLEYGRRLGNFYLDVHRSRKGT